MLTHYFRIAADRSDNTCQLMAGHTERATPEVELLRLPDVDVDKRPAIDNRRCDRATKQHLADILCQRVAYQVARCVPTFDRVAIKTAGAELAIGACRAWNNRGSPHATRWRRAISVFSDVLDGVCRRTSSRDANAPRRENKTGRLKSPARFGCCEGPWGGGFAVVRPSWPRCPKHAVLTHGHLSKRWGSISPYITQAACHYRRFAITRSCADCSIATSANRNFRTQLVCNLHALHGIAHPMPCARGARSSDLAGTTYASACLRSARFIRLWPSKTKRRLNGLKGRD